MLDKPENLWKMYIDFEIGEGERERARDLYERLMERTKHVKVWISFARFEAVPLHRLQPREEGEEEEVGGGSEEEGATYDMQQRAREIYRRAYKYFRDPNLEAKEECVMVLEAWKSFEQENGSSDDVAAVQEKMPRQVKRRRPVRDEHTGEEVGMEEYFDYLFPDEAGAAPLQALLAAAHKWKKRKVDEESG